MKTLTDFVYTLLIASGVTLFVGLGIWTFYSGPKAPAYPQGPYIYKEPTAEQQIQIEQQQKSFDVEMKKFNDIKRPYSRNVATISLVAGIAFFVGGVLLIRRSNIVGEGLGLGGVFTGVYSAVRAVTASSKPLVFASVSLILAMLILLAVLRRGLAPQAKAP